MKIQCLLLRSVALSVTLSSCLFSQDAAAPAAKTPLDHVLGTITAVDQSAQTVTVKEDKTSASDIIKLTDTKTLLKVAPTAKDLKNATRITADVLAVGDRVDVRGTKLPDSPTTFNARSVILMSARALEETHQQQAAAWAHSINGLVTAVDASSGVVTITSRVAGAPQTLTVKTSPTTEITRYSPDAGRAVPSQITQIEAGDQVRVIGDKAEGDTTVNAQRLYSGAFRTISATVSSLGADGKSMTVKDLSTKKDLSITLTTATSIHKLPPMMAGFLARRLNPSAAGTAPPGMGPGGPQGNAQAPGNGPAQPPSGPGDPSSAPAGPAGAPRGPGGPGGSGRGDISQMIDRTPTIALSDLKAGDALVISGVATGGAEPQLLANTVIAGVEPILQAAPQRGGSGRSVGGDWGLGEMSAPQ